MAEETKKKSTKKAKTENVVETSSKKESKVNDSWAKMSISELKVELQKLNLDVRTGREKNTSLVSKLKKHIAKELTKLRLEVAKP